MIDQVEGGALVDLIGRDRFGELAKIFQKVLNGNEVHIDKDDEMDALCLIEETAMQVSKREQEALNLESKVILSMATRLAAERIMIDLIDDIEWVNGVKKIQTDKLSVRFKKEFEHRDGYEALCSLMDRVNLMTPENIHLNSFMYEPILDMSGEHLCRLFLDVREAEQALKE